MKAIKNFFEFTAGLNTESSPLNFPPNSSLDEENYELLITRERRRRRGCRPEDGGILNITSNISSRAEAKSSYIWRSPGGDSNLVYTIIQAGTKLHFYNDQEILSQGYYMELDIGDYATNLALAEATPFTYASGKSLLFVASPYMETVYISIDAGEFLITPIYPKVRLFKDVEDDVSINKSPTIAEMATITDAYAFNLLNRGWNPVDYNQYETDKSAWPSKAMLWQKGYRKKAPAAGTLSTSDIAYDDWDQEWNSDKLELELLENSSAPRGSLITSPYDTTEVVGKPFIQTTIRISNWTAPSYTALTWAVTITTASAHGLSPADTVQISGNRVRYRLFIGSVKYTTLNGIYTCLAGTTGSTIVVDIPNPLGKFAGWPVIFSSQYNRRGSVKVSGVLNPVPFQTNDRPGAVSYFAGRVFLAGIKDPELTDVVLFSQIGEDLEDYNKMYQERDPTSPQISILLPTDGGTIQVPGMGLCYKMVPYLNSLLLFSENGVWAISGLRNGPFQADSYQVTKMSDIECYGPLSIVQTDNGIVFGSKRGIFNLGPNEFGDTVVTSLSENTIQTLWNSIIENQKRVAVFCYDDALKRLRIVYNGTLSTGAIFAYSRELVLDMRLGAWYFLKYPINIEGNHIGHVFCIDSGDNSNQDSKTKYAVFSPVSASINICDRAKSELDTDLFTDFDGTEQIPYLITGYDSMDSDFSSFRQAPYIHVFTRRTETYFISGEEGDDGVLTVSSVLIQSRWDWSSSNVSGKWGSEQQAYRVRKHVPVDGSGPIENGEPVNVAKLKIRGRGRALHLKFTGEEGKDSIILGWSVLYNVRRNNESSA